MSDAAVLLDVNDLAAGYGNMRAVHGVTLNVRAGEVVTVLGRNGVGKTTSMLAIAGQRYSKCTGTVTLLGTDISKMAPSKVVGKGLALVPEGHRIFHSLSVLENLELGAAPIPRSERRDSIKESLERVFGLFAILKEFQSRPVGQLSGGQQQMVAIGQALMAKPQVLLLDEPTSGLATSLCNEIYNAVTRLKADGLAILIVEQNVQRALNNSDRYYVMERGRLVRAGKSSDADAFATIEGVILGTTRVDDVAR
jgi:branched-chain amino acid transport system ATP-binding protein